jgi:hypothetical protein
MADIRPYYYEHTNGTVHRKPAIVVDMGGGPREYFASPYVQRWWREGDEPRPITVPNFPGFAAKEQDHG